MKAIILAAGVGSRIKPLTDNCPKSLLKVGSKTILGRMLCRLQACGITQVVFVLGYLEDQIRDYVTSQFPDIDATFVVNDAFATTNTGYSLMLALRQTRDATIVKFDADVVFDEQILRRIIDSNHQTCLCIDKHIQLDAEEIKVTVDDNNRVEKVSKSVPPTEAIGESIGIEKISGSITTTLLAQLEEAMGDPACHQEYYEASYERLIATGTPFHTVDISDLNWVEIDTKEDYALAHELFGQS